MVVLQTTSLNCIRNITGSNYCMFNDIYFRRSFVAWFEELRTYSIAQNNKKRCYAFVLYFFSAKIVQDIASYFVFSAHFVVFLSKDDSSLVQNITCLLYAYLVLAFLAVLDYLIQFFCPLFCDNTSSSVWPCRKSVLLM